MIQRILVGYDESDAARRAFSSGVELASRFGARLTVLAIVRIPEPAIFAEVEGIIDRAEEHFKEAFQALSETARQQGIALETAVLVGHPAEQIVHFAEEHGVDLIVVGNRGLSQGKRWLLGSVSERVLRYAHCPVMVVR